MHKGLSALDPSPLVPGRIGRRSELFVKLEICGNALTAERTHLTTAHPPQPRAPLSPFLMSSSPAMSAT